MNYFSRLCAIILIIILLPLLLIIVLGSIIFQGTPLIYNQERTGSNYKTFTMYKFRTMVINDSNEFITKMGDDRITQWGHFVRILKLDELPQLWNIVKGDMGFVGPRPEVPEYVIGNDFSFLRQIKPGLTDFSSIIFRNEEEILFKVKGRYQYQDLIKLKILLAKFYTNKKCIATDLFLVGLTILVILFPVSGRYLINRFFLRKYAPELINEIDKWFVDS